ncbi:trypsin-like peptidase domain-containing protein [Bacteriovorax sp. Seq25_V]|uniref:trypsin-like peptidase domain-containing protein n=1 Tax=Bacteriovorax sp. Seq25_V TaxID=1201288 RepID=UPI000389DEFC|nr:trypsin-like peptidase domain-containing protein [Bacteriovorax sp. Seq25_V]EQC43931.1 hypothetical protein M900_1161 [Bacteriovorax sp. Seq25_V]
MNNILIGLLCILIFSSCGGGDKIDLSKPSSPGTAKISTSVLASNIEFSCEDSKCPSAYGLVIKNLSNDLIANSNVCSGFFISKKDIITSRECIGSFIEKCSTGIAVKDIKGNAALCKNITHGFVNTNGEEDLFVHIELADELDVEPVTLSKESFKTTSSYERWNVVRSYENDKYHLEKTKYCRMTKNNIRFPFQQNGEQREIILTNCPPGAESLGAAILDSNGNVVGLATGIVEKTDIFNNLMGTKKGRNLLIATPLNCLAYQRSDLFPEIKLTREQEALCSQPIGSVTSSSMYNFFISTLFYGTSGGLEKNKIVVTQNNWEQTEFYKISHPECIGDERDLVDFNSCQFYPLITADYELYRTRVSRCYTDKSIKFKIKSNQYYSLFEVGVMNNGAEVSSLYISKCN